MSLMSQRDIDSLGTAIAASFDMSFTVYRPTGVPDGAGGVTKTRTQIGGTIAGFMASPGASTQIKELAARYVNEVIWSLVCAKETDIKYDDIVVIGGKDYPVIGFVKPTQSYHIANYVVILERKSGN